MKNKFVLALITLVIFVACNVGDRNKAGQIIADFQAKNVPDKREVVFNVEAVFENGNLVVTGEISDENLKKELTNALKNLKFKDELTLLPDSSVGQNTFALVNVPVANLRANPDHSAELVSQAILGTPVKILKKANDWFYVQTPDKYISWVDDAALVPVSKQQLEKWRHSDRVICTAVNTQIFETEKFENPVSNATLGCILEKSEQGWNWSKITFPDGRTGFVLTAEWEDFNVFKNTVKPTSEAIIAQAKSLTGRAYLWGGTSANTMDCSGFVKTVYFNNGLILARDASLQTQHGKTINVDNNFDELQPGDLLFFGRKATETSNERVTHVAISLGGTEFIHESGMVKQNSFNPESEIYSEYRRNSLVRAKRIIDVTDNGIQPVNEHPWY